MLKQKYIEETRRKLLYLVAPCASSVSPTSRQVTGQSRRIKDESSDACVTDMAWRKETAILILASLFFAGELDILKHINHDLIYMSVKWFVRIFFIADYVKKKKS